ncbi:MAG: Gfo/Idh/MocA family oxidoreductase [Clostridiales bacterium]|jgi:predicted dehydrogenase|nr:Gfo/Idh/MocA family oxidoreductase [Clostridiales bacterium]
MAGAKRIGFIGYGLRAHTMMKAFWQVEAGVEVAAVADPRWEQIRRERAGDACFAGAAYMESAEELLSMGGLDGVLVCTRCSTHAKYAAMAIRAGLPLFLEKPVCVSREQLAMLAAAAAGRPDRTVVSFPLRFTAIARQMKRLLDSGALGRITLVQAANNVPYGGVYYHSWYRDDAETGGLFLQKATHDIDCILHMLGERPVEAAAMAAKLYFRGDRPAGLRCAACGERRECVESDYFVSKRMREDVTGEMCCFAEDTGNEDTAALLLRSESGAIVAYSQSFVVKKAAARRGARFVGTEGSAEFDFYTGELRHDSYREHQTSLHRITPPAANHWGGDEELALAFMAVLDGKPSAAPLLDGLASAACCLAARESARTGAFAPVGLEALGRAGAGWREPAPDAPAALPIAPAAPATGVAGLALGSVAAASPVAPEAQAGEEGGERDG